MYDSDIKMCNAELIYKLDSSLDEKKILYFGESSNFTTSNTDSCKKSISELLDDYDKDYNIGTISKGAIHASTYYKLISRIPEKNTIKAIIVTVNLRSFGINWIESELETNLSRAEIIYATYPPVFKKFQLSFKWYDNVPFFKRKERIKWHYRHDTFSLVSKKFRTVRDWDKEVFNSGIPDADGKKDPVKTNVACHFIKNYAFVITGSNPRIHDLDNIIELCKKKKIRLIFNLLPENHEKATELCGEDLEILMRKNVSFLKERYKSKTIFIDNFSLLPDSCFIDKDWPTEHYDYFGRKEIVNTIDSALKTIKKRVETAN